MKGLFVGVNKIPIDDEIISQMNENPVLDMDEHDIRRSLMLNKHNGATASYYLLLKKLIKSGGQSSADISRKDFEPEILAPRPPSGKRNDNLNNTSLPSGKRSESLSSTTAKSDSLNVTSARAEYFNNTSKRSDSLNSTNRRSESVHNA